jgi:predicted nucleic acid-binding protein
VEVRDPDDEVVLPSAIAADADVLVTGDSDLFDIADQVKALRIMTPRRFWEEVR